MAKSETDPPDAVLLRMIGGYRITQAIYVATKLGIPDAIREGPQDAGELAKDAGVDPGHLHRLLRALATVGVVRMDDAGRFASTPLTELLRHDPGGSMADVAVFAGEEAYRAWGDLLHTVRTGTTAFDHVFGMGHFDYLAENPEASATFNRLMAWSSALEGDPLGGYELDRHRLLVDVGGGKGALVASVLRTHPRLRAILYDQASAVADAPPLLRSHGVADRCEIRTGSAFDSVPSGGDVYLLSRVLHDWPEEKALALLTNCRKAMAPGSVLFVL